MTEKNEKLHSTGCPIKSGMIKELETGRTMVEILGVLAIVGILSVVSIFMYIYLMGVYRENETLDVIDKVAVGAYTSKDKGEEGAGIGNKLPANVISSGIEQRDEYTLDTRLGTAVSAFRLSENEYEVYLENISYGVCKKVLNGTSDYVSAYLNRTSGDGIYVGDSEEDKDAFCERVDAFKREVPYINVQENNPNANMILCYSLSDEGCDIPYTLPPPPTEQPCGVIPHGGQVNDCGVCDNGNYRMGAVPENPCVRCDATTNYINEARIGEECQDSCHVCDASKNCVAEDEDRPEDCGGVCCPDGKCNSDRTGCQQECAGGCNVCQMCDTDTGSCVSDVDQNGDPQADGKCCVDGVLKYDENLCPDPATQCTFGGKTYNNGASVGTCGKCVNGEIQKDTSNETMCKICNTSTWTLTNEPDGSNKQIDGTCCIGGVLTNDENLCPECPETITKTVNKRGGPDNTSLCVFGRETGSASTHGCNGDYFNTTQCSYSIKLNGRISTGVEPEGYCAAYLDIKDQDKNKILSCGNAKTYKDKIVGVLDPGDSIKFWIYNNNGDYNANLTTTLTRIDLAESGDWQSFDCPAGEYYSYTNGKCKICPERYYCAENRTDREKCPEGYYCPGKGNVNPIPCPAGTYSLVGASSCTTCNAGYYCPGASNHKECPAGYYCPAGATKPLACPPGTYSGKGDSSCTPCSAGYYCPGASNRVKCPAGSYCPTTNLTKPTACPAGTYTSTTAQKSCKTCDAGYYCPGNSDKISCPDKMYCPAGATQAQACPDGKYYYERGSHSTGTICSDCTAGYYCKNGEKTKCGYRQISAKGQSSCTTCPDGQYANSAHKKCGNSSSTYKY